MHMPSLFLATSTADVSATFAIALGVLGWIIGGVGLWAYIKGSSHRAKYDQLLEDNKGWENSVRQRDTRIKDLETENKAQANRMHDFELKLAQFQNQPIAFEGMQAELREMQKTLNESTKASNERQSQLMLSQTQMMKELLLSRREDKRWAKVLNKHSEAIEELLKSSAEQRALLGSVLEYVKPPAAELAAR